MAVKRCPRCGDLYLAAVDVCADCGDTLVEVADEAETQSSSEPQRVDGASGHDEWALDAWTMEARRLVDGMLSNAEVPRSWQGAVLLTPVDFRDRVDEMVQAVAARDVEAVGDEPVGYEVSDWTEDALDRLVALLARERVPYRWDDDGDLEVAGEHEPTVDAIFAELTGDGAESDTDDIDDIDDGVDAHETMSDLFLAADRLARNPLDASAGRSAVDASNRVADMALPFGFAPKVWEAIVEQGQALASLIEASSLDDDAVEQQAVALRDLLRDYI